jgi:hypothetical protein
MLSASHSVKARDVGMKNLFSAVELDTAILHIFLAARRKQELTSDDVWVGLEAAGIQSLERPNIMGAALRSAASQGLISATDRVRKSCRVSRHRSNVQVWKSLVFQGEVAA